jgi:hypothetical protein
MFCPGWSATSILLISVSQVSRITGVRHRCMPSLVLNPMRCWPWGTWYLEREGMAPLPPPHHLTLPQATQGFESEDLAGRG